MAKEIKILIGVVGLSLAGLVLLVKFTDVCQLQAVTLNGQPVSQWDRTLGFNAGRNLFRQPLDSVAEAMLAQNGIVHVNIKYQLPNGLSISTNNLDPACYVLDDFSGIIYGVDRTGRTVALDPSTIDWERPIITGVRVRRLHEFCSDSRITVLVPQILRLQQEYPDVFRLIEEINLSNPEYVRVSIAGLKYALKLPGDRFAERFIDYRKFMSRFKPATAGVSAFDLTYDDMIIRVGSLPQKKKAVLDTASINDVAQFQDDSAPPVMIAPAAVKPAVAETPAVKKSAPVVKKSSAVKPATKSLKSKPAAVGKKWSPAKKGAPSKGSAVKSPAKKSSGGKSKPIAKKSSKKTS